MTTSVISTREESGSERTRMEVETKITRCALRKYSTQMITKQGEGAPTCTHSNFQPQIPHRIFLFVVSVPTTKFDSTFASNLLFHPSYLTSPTLSVFFQTLVGRDAANRKIIPRSTCALASVPYDDSLLSTTRASSQERNE